MSMNTTQTVLAERQAQLMQRAGQLAYERLQLMKRVEEIDRMIAKVEGGQEMNAQAQKTVAAQIAVDEAIAKAKAVGPAEEAPNA